MAKISPVSGKYIINANIKIEGVVDRPDIIGAIFGQTEGLLGSELELRELQRSGRIGRIEVNTESKQGKTHGDIVIPSSLDKAETAIVAAALEIIERIGPCNATIRVQKIEDIRISKRTQVISRAKELLKTMQTTVMPDSQEMADSVAASVRQMEISVWGPEKLPCGPAIDESEEIIVVEGRADVVMLLKHGFKNAIAMNGSSVPKSLAKLCKEKVVTMFVDGDRGGILNIKEMMSVSQIEYVAKAPDGKEVEELTMKEIHKALRSRVTPDQIQGELASKDSLRQPIRGRTNTREPRGNPKRTVKPSDAETKAFADLLDDLVGSHAAALVGKDLKVLGKVPISEVGSTLEGLEEVHAVVVDGEVTRDLTKSADKNRVRFCVGRESSVKDSRCAIVVQ